MSILVDEAVAHITNNPEKYNPLGNSQFNGFGNDTYIVEHAGNNSFVLGDCSVICLRVNGTSVDLCFFEKRKLEKISLWWWKNVPTVQMTFKE